MIDRLLEALHGRYVHGRRVRVLRDRLLRLLPPDGSVLDVGCGDGRLARAILEQRPTLHMTGLDVHVRSNTHIPVSWFNGVEIPFPSNAFDVVMFVDVLHHSTQPEPLLREAKRLAKRWVVIKDHLCESHFDFHVLRMMDWVGNARHGVALPHNYWPRHRWRETFSTLDMAIDSWDSAIGLYPWPANKLFDRHLHFIARLSSARQ